MVVYNGIDGEVALHAMFVARPGYFPQIVDSEGICRTGTHVQVLDTEIRWSRHLLVWLLREIRASLPVP